MKNLLSLLCLALVAVFGVSIAVAGNVQPGTSATTIRASGNATSTADLSTTTTISNAVDAVHLYCTVGNIGASTGVGFYVMGSYDSSVAASSYFHAHDGNGIYYTTGTAAGVYHLRVPREALGGNTFGVRTISPGGTATGVVVKYKPEQ